MIVTAALSWYNETPETLHDCVYACRDLCDAIVAVDGAYARFPGAKTRSPRTQAEAIKDAASDAGMRCTIVSIDRLWAGQCEKRTYLLNLAAIGSNWIASIDADHVIHGDREAARDILSDSRGVDVYDVRFVTPLNDKRSLAQSVAGAWHETLAGTELPVPHLFRALPGFQVERFHWWYSAVNESGRVWLWGGDKKSYPPVDIHHLPLADYWIEHRTLFRSRQELLANRAYCNDREMVKRLTGQEDDRPDLPRPVFDYATFGP